MRLKEALIYMQNDKNALFPETILNDKYHILTQIGKGGFSITYLAERIADGKILVIKELFVDEYMERQNPDEYVYLRKASFKQRFDQDIQHFQIEWKMLNEFKCDPGAVQAIDYFEANNTVYIVMEHLAGGSLKDHVRKDGKIDEGVLYRSLKNVLQLVSNLHASGYIHGDISPDNLIMDGDSYKLIDFGAVREIGEVRAKEGPLRKEGYTPAEVFSRNYKADPRSDIYSICATCYYAVTGKEPEDALERVILDELKPVSELNAEVDPLIEEIIMKGISMMPGERWESVHLIQTQIEKYEKAKDKKTIEEASKKKKQKIYRHLTRIAVLFVILVLGYIFYCTHKKLIKFKGQDVQNIVFYYEEGVRQEDIDKVNESIRNKITDIAGKNGYLLKLTDEYVEIDIAYNLIKDLALSDLLNKYFCFSKCDIGYFDANNIFIPIKPFTKEDISEYVIYDDKCSISIDEKLWNKIIVTPEKKNQLVLRIYTEGNGNHIWDKSNIPYEGDQYDLIVDYDLKDQSIIIKNDHSQINEGALLIDCLYEEHVPIGAFNYGRHVIWEQKQETTWGRNQVDVSEFKDGYILLSYMNKYPDEQTHNLFSTKIREEDVEGNTDVICLKKRLDALNAPYSCGWDKNNFNEIYIAIESTNIWELEAAILFEDFSINSYAFESDNVSKAESYCIKSISGISLPYIDLSVPFDVKKESIIVKIDDIYAMNAALQRIRDIGDDRIQLCIGNRPAFQASLENISKDGYIVFDVPLLNNLEDGKLEREVAYFVEFLNSMIDTVSFLSMYDFTGAQFIDSSGKELWNRDCWCMRGCEDNRQRTQVRKYLTSILGESTEINWNMEFEAASVINVKCNYDESLAQAYIHPFAIVKELLDQIVWSNEITCIDFQIIDQRSCGISYDICVDRSLINGRYHFRWSVNEWNNNYADSEKNIETILSKKEDTINYLSSEKIFANGYLEPALTNSFEESLEDDIASINISIQDTSIEQDYSLDYSVYNKTNEKIAVCLKRVSINNVMPSSFYGSTITVAPGNTGNNTEKFIAEDFRNAQKDKIENAILQFQIEYGNTIMYKDIVIPQDTFENITRKTIIIPPSALPVTDTDEYSIYCLGFGWQNDTVVYYNEQDIDWKHARFIFVNKTKNHLVITFTGMAFDNVWDEEFPLEKIDVLPLASITYDLYYDSPTVLNPKDIMAKVSIENNGSDNPDNEVSNIEFQIEERKQ